MNYYNPNFYQNYNQYPTPIQQPMGINGKVVDSEEMVRVSEVPIGGYGVFPKADLSEIYIKNWNPNGTTSIVTFKPYIPPEPVIEEGPGSKEILDRISALESKLDAVLNVAPAKTKGVANEY